MANPRLPFLYPNLMRAVKACEPSTYRSIRIPSNARPPRAPFHTTPRHAQDTYQRRYGPAVEPNLPPPSPPKDGSASQQPHNHSPENTSNVSSPPEQPPLQDSQNTQKSDPTTTASQPDDQSTTKSDDSKSLEEQEPLLEEEPIVEIHEDKQESTSPEEPTSEEQYASQPLGDNPLDEVLHMPSPTSYLTPTATLSEKPPHMAPPPYIHHFDSYTLVRDLGNGGFSDKQSITIMKAVRKILQKNLDFANHSLTSKSDVENESYLFQAACSELQSSLQTARNAETQHQRASRAHLEHESDILSQRTNQELAGLKDDIKGMFNDHKMVVRELQRSIDTSVQELNYKITVSLNSDSKSEIEGLRWILTRRAAMAIAISAFMIILFLKYLSVQKTQNNAAKKEEPPKESKETRTTSDFAPHAKESVPAAHLSESLG
ncbi:hypothetical protein ARAM_002210 [Aspergillus rambellii]|uniref:Uncharacterized protein n=1 Tax=Aspergillus rambellii TaxID=308745 RepID=A0A0F8VRA2_9EURO|nr:hypothetical protein ARAM_002210 [Aspergillus rambellii]